MATLTKTQQALLQRASQSGGRSGLTTTYGRGPRGGRITYGARERDAMFRLQELGLIRIVDRQPWQDYNRGYSQSGNYFCYELVS